MQQFEVRQATPGDRDTLYRIKRETIRPYVEQVWGWDEELQERRFCESYDHTATQVVVVDGLAVGLLRVSERESAVFIDQVEITPKYQSQGIGTSLINDLLARGRPVELGVLKVNVDARRLYERLGFRVTGETETHYNMRAERHSIATHSAPPCSVAAPIRHVKELGLSMRLQKMMRFVAYMDFTKFVSLLKLRASSSLGRQVG